MMTNETDNLSMTNNFNQWEEEITFWIEGILTPGVSTAGIIGKAIKKKQKKKTKKKNKKKTRWPFDKFKESLD